MEDGTMDGSARGLATATLIFTLWAAGPAAAEPRPYRIDPEHAGFGFLVSHLGIADTLGLFREVEGGFTFDDQAMTVSDIEVTVRTGSVFTGHEARDAHLRKKDFLWVEEHPTMTFVGRSAERTGERTGRITGDLTLRGVTRPVTLDVTLTGQREYPFPPGHHAVGVSARGVLKRSDFGMTYGLDGNLVGDEVQLLISLEGMRQE